MLVSWHKDALNAQAVKQNRKKWECWQLQYFSFCRNTLCHMATFLHGFTGFSWETLVKRKVSVIACRREVWGVTALPNTYFGSWRCTYFVKWRRSRDLDSLSEWLKKVDSYLPYSYWNTPQCRSGIHTIYGISKCFLAYSRTWCEHMCTVRRVVHLIST